VQQRITLAIAVICVLAAGCSAYHSQASPTSTAAAPVSAAALDDLLLSAADVSASIGVAQVSVVTAATQMDDMSALVSRPECLPIYSPAESHPYDGSGWTSVRRQDLSDPSHTHSAVQSAVLFPSAQQAATFFTTSSQSWQACANDSFAHNMTGGREFWNVGPVSNVNGVWSATAQISLEVFDAPDPHQGRGSTGQPVLTVRNNVVIAVFTDSPAANDPAAANVAQRIAAKVPS
jgi:hypothetical protein